MARHTRRAAASGRALIDPSSDAVRDASYRPSAAAISATSRAVVRARCVCTGMLARAWQRFQVAGAWRHPGRASMATAGSGDRVVG